jgi:LruC domain-containing protein
VAVNSGDLDVLAYEKIRSLWVDGSNKFVNTETSQSLIKGHRFSFDITLNTPIGLGQLGTPPFDPYIYVHDTQYEIHRAGQAPVLPYSRNVTDGLTSFKDPSGYPFAMILPEDWRTPVELEDLGAAYPDFLNFVTSGGSSNAGWYQTPAPGKTQPLTPSIWRW